MLRDCRHAVSATIIAGLVEFLRDFAILRFCDFFAMEKEIFGNFRREKRLSMSSAGFENSLRGRGAGDVAPTLQPENKQNSQLVRYVANSDYCALVLQALLLVSS